MVSTADNGLFDRIEFVPLTRLAIPTAAFKQAGVVFSHGDDDLDTFDYAVLRSSDKQLFALVHYRSQASDVTDIFVPIGFIGLAPQSVQTFVSQLAQELEIEPAYFSFRDSLAEAVVTNGEPTATTVRRPTLPIAPVPVIQVARSASR